MKIVYPVLLVGMLMVSCTEDPNFVTNQALQGTWDITSMTLGGQEQLGADTNKFFINEANIEFLGASDDNGTWTKKALISKGGPNEQESTSLGTYVITSEGESITMTDTDNDVIVLKVSIDGNEYTLTGTDKDNNALAEKATKR